MKHDPFDFDPRMDRTDRIVRVVFLIIMIGILAYDTFIARPL